MKAKFMIGKRQIILSALTVILGGAIYLNFVYSGESLSVTEALAPTEEQTIETMESVEEPTVTPGNEVEEPKNYGDATLVNGVPDSTDDYFAEATLIKQQNHDQAVQTVQTVLSNVDVSEEEMAQATAKIVELSEQIEAEGRLEGLIKAKGFTECLVYLDQDTASVVVESDGLTVEEAAQIKHLVLNERSVPQENISITEVSPQS